jgi:hypothetical protein
MTSSNELRTAILAVAKRSVSIMGACSNEESAKLYLALPFLGLLGYDYTNPYEVYPDHVAGFPPSGPQRIDFAVLRDGTPIIGMEVRAAGTDIAGERGELAAYFNAVATAKLGILTNGVLFSFYVDSDRPDTMDNEPFLTVDLETIARVGVTDEALDSLLLLTKANFDPETVAEAAHVQLIKKRLRNVFVDEANGPSEDFCRFALGRVGLRNVKAEAIDRYYAPMIKSAFEESLVLPVVQRLRADPSAEARNTPASLHQIGQRIATSEREIALLGYVRRRLAYLVEDEQYFDAIEGVQAKDYVGRLVIYYGRERKGRLFDFIASPDKTDKYVFPDPIGEIVTNTITDIDAALKVTFISRVRELSVNAQGTPPQKVARSA